MRSLLFIPLLFSAFSSFGQDDGDKYCNGGNCIVFFKRNSSDNEGKFTQCVESNIKTSWAVGNGFFNESPDGKTIYLTYDTISLKLDFKMKAKKALSPDTIYIEWSDTTKHLQRGHIKFQDTAYKQVYDADYDAIIKIPLKDLKSKKLFLNNTIPFEIESTEQNYIRIYANDLNYVHKLYTRQDRLSQYKNGYIREGAGNGKKDGYFKKS